VDQFDQRSGFPGEVHPLSSCKVEESFVFALAKGGKPAMPIAAGSDSLELNNGNPQVIGPALIRRNVLVKNANGLHLLPCSLIARTVKDFNGTVKLIRGSHAANAKSIMDVIQLGAVCGTELVIEVEGHGAEGLMDRLELLFADEFSTDR
jgi:phosphotransferase system HPr (HPr) family protein